MSNRNTKSEPLMSRASGPLQGEVSVPGDKSISHRALIFGALAEGPTQILGLLESEDILGTASALRALGIAIEKDGTSYTLTGRGLSGLSQPVGELDFGNSGTGARLMMGVIAGQPLEAKFTGDASLRKRPMGRVLDPLKAMGAVVDDNGRGTLPLTLTGSGRLQPITYVLPVPSAQVKSAILLAGLTAEGQTTVFEPEATRDHTERMLKHFGARINAFDKSGGRQIDIQGGHSFAGSAIQVPGDPSSAAFLASAALLCPGSEIFIRDVLVNKTRVGFYMTLKEMGANVDFISEREVNGEPVADIRVRYGKLRGVTVPAERAPSMIDEYPCLAVVAAFAEGRTLMEGLAELRVKESDRLSAMVAGLRNCGVTAVAEGDTLSVEGRPGDVQGGGESITTHMDHRIAMAFLVMGLASKKPVTVDDGSMIGTSFPEFRSLISQLGGSIANA